MKEGQLIKGGFQTLLMNLQLRGIVAKSSMPIYGQIEFEKAMGFGVVFERIGDFVFIGNVLFYLKKLSVFTKY